MLLAEAVGAARWSRNHATVLWPHLQEVDATDEVFKPEICEVGAANMDRCKIVVADILVRPL